MGVLDAALGKVAQTLIGKFGRPAVIVRQGAGGGYNARTGTITGAATEFSIPCEVVFEEYTESQVDGTLIRAGDRVALVSRLRIQATEDASASPEPIPQSDVLTEGGRTWQIVRVTGISSGEQEAVYKLQVRR